MGSPPQANATILRVGARAAVPAGGGAGVVDDWDQDVEVPDVDPGDELEPGDKWRGAAGEVRAYYREATDRVTGAGAVDVHERRELILLTADLEELGIDTDDVVTFLVDGEDGEQSGTAEAVRRSKLAGMPSSVQTAKLTLSAA